MGNATTNFSISLDGFVADKYDDTTEIFKWYGLGDIDYKMPGGDWKFKVSAATAKLLDESIKKAGVLITGHGRLTSHTAGMADILWMFRSS